VPASTLLDRAPMPVALRVVGPESGGPGHLGGHSLTEVHPDQLTLPLVWEVSPGVPSIPALPRHLRLVGQASEDADPPGQHQAGPEQPAAPLSSSWVARMARAIIEVADGDRPASQLARWVDRAPLSMITARGVGYRRHPSVRNRRGALAAVRATQQVRAVRLCPVTPLAVEASAVLVGGGRGRAVALRFEARGEHWIVAAVAFG